MARHRGERGDDLHTGRSVADHSDALARELDALRPRTGVEDLPAVAVHTLESWLVGRGEKAEAGHQVFSCNLLSPIRRDPPQPGSLIEMGRRDLGVEPIGATQVVFVGKPVQIFDDLRLGQVARRPFALLEQILVKGIAVAEALGV